MTPKEWLERGFKLNGEIEQLKIAKDKAKELSQDSGAQENESYREYCRLLFRQIDRLLQINKEVAEVISMLDDSLLRTILTARYINCSTWSTIAEDMDIDQRWLYRLHKKALDIVGAILIENEK